jgi:hypothetical protein
MLVIQIVSKVQMDFCPSSISSLIWMKTQSIMITLIPKSTPTNFGMESWCVDSLIENPPFATMFSTSVQLQTNSKTTHIVATCFLQLGNNFYNC